MASGTKDDVGGIVALWAVAGGLLGAAVYGCTAHPGFIAAAVTGVIATFWVLIGIALAK